MLGGSQNRQLQGGEIQSSEQVGAGYGANSRGSVGGGIVHQQRLLCAAHGLPRVTDGDSFPPPGAGVVRLGKGSRNPRVWLLLYIKTFRFFFFSPTAVKPN